jgi:hypothetical protein
LIERDGYPAGVPCWVDTDQPDAEGAVEFYGGLFGWEFDHRLLEDSPDRYYVARLRGREVAAVASRQEGAPDTPVAWNTYIAVDSADQAAAKIKEAGGSVVMEPFDVLDAGRMAVCSDPAGAVFCVWEARGSKGAQLVNEPNTWNFSDLNTDHAGGAKAFYGEVFGWVASDAGGFTMLRLPGYGDYLATLDPSIRERQAEGGAPEGFEDAIGFIAPAGDKPPHWAITFAVDDADAAAERAADLGGKVLTPPQDLPFVRMAVLSDPQGAAFTVSKYVPENG